MQPKAYDSLQRNGGCMQSRLMVQNTCNQYDRLFYPVSIIIHDKVFPVNKILEEKYLPSSLAYQKRMGSTWTYNKDFIGEITGCLPEMSYFKISDSIFTEADLNLGFEITYSNGEESYLTNASSYIREDHAIKLLALDDGETFFNAVFCILEEAEEYNNVSPGIYVYNEGEASYIEKIYIPGYDGLPQTIEKAVECTENFIENLTDQVAERLEQSLLEVEW